MRVETRMIIAVVGCCFMLFHHSFYYLQITVSLVYIPTITLDTSQFNFHKCCIMTETSQQLNHNISDVLEERLIDAE